MENVPTKTAISETLVLDLVGIFFGPPEENSL